ncbi:helix-turn-helix transcriptional regulator [Lysobacter sp. FW306-1B-D06B]|uniref:helix-turn-helix domain-containing protein n=1 Tax=Lysobacter sp. FW306-1B-D06B TaxID=3140250 RepID=UPI0031402297
MQPNDEAAGVMESLDWLESIAASSPVSTGKQDQVGLVRTIGARMRHARELCNLSQSAAAKRLGYANPSKLSKVEAAADTNSVPLWLIRRAAEEYEVSVDFLFGFSDDWETGARMTQEREVSAWLKEQWKVARERDLSVLRMLNDRLFEMRSGVAAIHAGIREANMALEKFADLNPEFAEDMRGSNRLVNAMTQALAATERTKAKLRMDVPMEIA